ncbi:hypothetical protein ACQJBY_048115 [Aegilops geniculata]
MPCFVHSIPHCSAALHCTTLHHKILTEPNLYNTLWVLLGSLYLLGIAKSRKMILAYVTRFLLLRFQKFCHAFICISLNNFLNETPFSTKDMMALQVPAGVVYICLYVRPFALGLGILGILAASLQKYWLLAKAALFLWAWGCFSAEVF